MTTWYNWEIDTETILINEDEEVLHDFAAKDIATFATANINEVPVVQ